jgi:hypothetical protein
VCLVSQHPELKRWWWSRSAKVSHSSDMEGSYQIDSRLRVGSRNDLPPMSLRGPRVAIVNVSVAFSGHR